MMTWIPVCRLPEIVEDKLLSVQLCNDSVIVSKDSGGRVSVVEAHCPHVGTHLGKNSEYSEGVVSCPLHHYKFRLSDGACLKNRQLRLRRFSTRVHEGLVWVETEAHFVEERAATPPAAPDQADVLSASWELDDAAFRPLVSLFSGDGEHRDGLRVEPPHRVFSHLKVYLAPIDDRQVRVFAIAFLADGLGLARTVGRLQRTTPGQKLVGGSLGALLHAPVVAALRKLSTKGAPPANPRSKLPLVGGGGPESRYQPARSFLNDWMFVGFAKEIGAEPKIVERMGRYVRIQRGAGGTIQVTSLDGRHRYATKVDPSYGVILAYFHADYAPPPWIIPDFDYDDRFEYYDRFLSVSQCAVQDLHGTVLDWTHLTGYHRYRKSTLKNSFVNDYTIGSTYVTEGKEFAKYFRLSDVKNTNQCTIHGLCTLDFHFRGYFDEEAYFELKLLSHFFISEGKSHQILTCSYRKDLQNAGPLLKLMYGPFKRFSYEVAKLDLNTETRAIYNHKRLLRDPRGVARFPYPALFEYAKKFYPDEVQAKGTALSPGDGPSLQGTSWMDGGGGYERAEIHSARD